MSGLLALLTLGMGLAAPGAAPTVDSVLRDDPELARHHQGYLHHLARNATLRQHETAYLQVLQDPDFAAAVRRFDEALRADPEAEQLFHQFYDQLVREPGLRRAVEGVQREAFDLPRRREDAVSDAFGYLQANPETALRFLAGPERFAPLPSSLAPVANLLARNPELRARLLDAFETLHEEPLAQTRVFPWWQRLSRLNAEAGGAYDALGRELLARPTRFWVWHRRHLALAEDAQARDWITWWHRRVRREPALREVYLDSVRTDLEQNAAPRLAQAGEGAADAVWPPKTAPPALGALAPNAFANTPDPFAIEQPTIERPARPSINRPRRPDLPDRPTVPNRPERPDRPERPTRPPLRTSE